MKFFIDTANLEQIRKAHELGVLDGVTTNPSLMAKENIRGTENCNRHYVEIDRKSTRLNSSHPSSSRMPSSA